MGNLSIRCIERKTQRAGSGFPPPALIGCDELQLVIPWRVGLHQSPPPLPQLADSMRYSRSARREFFSERQTVSYSAVSAKGSTSAFGSHLSVPISCKPIVFSQLLFLLLPPACSQLRNGHSGKRLTFDTKGEIILSVEWFATLHRELVFVLVPFLGIHSFFILS
jgi:hypothetical protein